MPRTPPPAGRQYWVGYCRKSTDSEDKQVHTLADQAKMIEDHHAALPDCDRFPLRLLQEAKSAFRPGRPVFQEVLDLADAGRVRGLIVVHPNRVSRNHADSGAFAQRLVEGKIPCLDAAGGKRYTGADSNDVFMLTLEGAMSWKDSRDKGDRIRKAMAMRAAEGKYMGPTPLGYRPVRDEEGRRRLAVDEAGLALRRLFELAATGSYSVRQLAAEARKAGLRTAGGRHLSRSSLHLLLKNPFYKGCYRYAGTLHKAPHEPLVDEAAWDRVQLALEGRLTNTARPKDEGLRALFVFGGLLRCPGCRRMLCPYRAKGKYVYYECKTDGRRCGVCVPQPRLVEDLWRVLDDVVLEGDELARLRKDLLARRRSLGRADAERRKALLHDRDRLQREIADLFAQRKEAERLGVLEAVDRRLMGLKRRSDELRAHGEAARRPAAAWVEDVVGCFELGKLLREAIAYGSVPVRESALKALASNYAVEGGKLLLDLRPPFRRGAKEGGRPGWWCELDDVRTEVSETFRLLQAMQGLTRIDPCLNT